MTTAELYRGLVARSTDAGRCTIRTPVVYDSLYGNTKAIAQAISDVLPGEVQVLYLSLVDAEDLEAVDLLIIGSPTHGALPTEAVQRLPAGP